MECVDVAIARQRHTKHMSAAADMHATIELLEVVFFTQSMLRLYKENQSGVMREL
jgi:hypothetical protein